MYNRLFTKILDSSIWLENDATRLVWITILASMDEDGFCPFSSIENLARRANIPLEETKQAVITLESEDTFNNQDEFQGRRIERVENGWMVLKAAYYGGILSREILREQTRIRVQRYREKQRNDVTSESLQNVTGVTNVTVTPVTYSDHTHTHTHIKSYKSTPEFDQFWEIYPRKVAKQAAIKAFQKVKAPVSVLISAIEAQKNDTNWKRDEGRFIPYPATWLNDKRWEDEHATNADDEEYQAHMRAMNRKRRAE